jgi:hypothetical protein
MHRRQAEVNLRWIAAGLEPFGLGIGVSTGVAAALLGSEERVGYIAGSTGAAGSWSVSDPWYAITSRRVAGNAPAPWIL